MRNFLIATVLCLALFSVPALSHHAAEGIVDEEIYEMIDGMIDDTPHAELTLDDLGGGMTEMTITTRTVTSMETMLDDGLLTYLSMLDGDVSVMIAFDPSGSVEMTITQTE